MRNIISGQKRTQNESTGSECTVIQTDLLLAQPQSSGCDISLEKKRDYLHHEPFPKSVKYDEGYI